MGDKLINSKNEIKNVIKNECASQKKKKESIIILKQKDADNTFTINWKRKRRLQSLQHAICHRNKHLNAPKSQIVLYHKSKPLLLDKTLNDYNFKDKITIVWSLENVDSNEKQNKAETKSKSKITIHLTQKDADNTLMFCRKKSCHIQSLRDEIFDKNKHLNKRQIILCHQNKRLAMNRSLKDYNFKNEITIIWSIENKETTQNQKKIEVKKKEMITLNIREEDSQNEISIDWKAKKPWFGSRIKEKIKAEFNIAANLRINVRCKKKLIQNSKETASHYNISNDSTLFWRFEKKSKKKNFSIYLQQKSETNDCIKVCVSKKSKMADIGQLIHSKKKYQFSYNGMLLSTTDCLECFHIINGETLIYDEDVSNYDWRTSVIVHFWRIFLA